MPNGNSPAFCQRTLCRQEVKDNQEQLLSIDLAGGTCEVEEETLKL
jgi:hypothetical protein